MTSPVLFNLLDTANAMKIGVATLNSPQTLNGLSLDMCTLLNEQLQLWKDDDSIALVVINGAGEKAFCAGGDLHGLYKGIQDNTSGLAWNNTYAREFFDVEYRLDYLIHTFPKPIVCWGNGIVMGGGVGLMMGASHRIVSETTRFAMPEISIGLFPDVGGTWMLSRLPGGTGAFLALTGAQLGASDCRFLGLADYTLASATWNDFLARAQASAWSGSRTDNDVALDGLLKNMAPDAAAPGPLQRHYELIRLSCDGPDFDAICARIQRWSANEDPWLKRAAATFNAGAPGSARLSFELLKRVRFMSLAEVFRQEYIVSLQCGVQGDFKEGIRALLIDKDKQPKWNPATLEGATQAWVQRFFEQPWPDSVAHPLADLA
ncbi:MAG TPA: enoyl-CoA hydratase/isomerase family protein [Candidimonas sp.]|nr:enoyl-CoA hydratase/isomerase family protein [Candidimonas sp.]